MASRNTKILCVALNCGVDKVYDCPGFGLTGIYQPRRAVTCIGGKGVNQARMAKTLGADVMAFGFAGGCLGLQTRQQLAAEGIAHEFTMTQDESRLAITILDSDSDTHTEINEWGPQVSRDELADMMERFRRIVQGVGLVTLSGSAPRGVPCDIYGAMIEIASKAGAATMLDARGEWLVNGLAAGPTIVKPNQNEAGQILGREPTSIGEAARAALDLCERGIQQVVVTLGAQGAVCAEGGVAMHAWMEPIEVVSAVGSGDAFAGALAAGFVAGQPLHESVRLGIACGAANAKRLGPAFVSLDEVKDLAKGVRMDAVAI